MAGYPVPVEACTGWSSPCSFCDKRFSEWIPILEDPVTIVPAKPGAFMFAFFNKRGQETVAISIQKTNVQASIMSQLRDLRRQVSEKKLKETKASILFRYLILEDMADKDACSIYAHWHNYGILPRFTTEWPGVAILANSTDFEYSEENKKWCHPVKDPVWRKKKINTKPPEVPSCKGWTEKCNYCDEKFSGWLLAKEIVSRKGGGGGGGNVPELPGFCMYAATRKRGKREVVYISGNENIKADIKYIEPWIINNIMYGKMKEFDKEVQVRWFPVGNLQEMDSCFMYAHFLNHGKIPVLCRDLPGNEILVDSEKFVFCQRNKQWCYDDGQVMPLKAISKTKERRNILLSALEDLHT